MYCFSVLITLLLALLVVSVPAPVPLPAPIPDSQTNCIPILPGTESSLPPPPAGASYCGLPPGATTEQNNATLVQPNTGAANATLPAATESSTPVTVSKTHSAGKTEAKFGGTPGTKSFLQTQPGSSSDDEEGDCDEE